MDALGLYDQLVERFGTDGLERVKACFEIMEGKRRAPVLHPDQEATRIFFPELEALAWHDPSKWDWVAPLEYDWKRILEEFQRVRAASTFAPYEDRYTKDIGWAGWQTWHIYRDGHITEKARDMCPITVEHVGASPHGVRECIYSVLTPGTHLKPHTGGVNLFLTVHLPLIVPPGCGLRVGDEVREWQPGKLVVFDDSFIHEAWNSGDSDRVVLLWDIWHPDLTEREKEVLTWLAPKLGEFLKGH
jgi:aspartyl/asparaginyl beta-hydroxylase (cupin superfamily)